MKPIHRRRKCPNCKQLFFPDPRSRYHQQFCSAAACQKASKSNSQKRWLNKPENEHYWSSWVCKEKVRLWREKNPKYWKAAAKPGATASRDRSAQKRSPKRVKADSANRA
jgi:hypothetical protein